MCAAQSCPGPRMPTRLTGAEGCLRKGADQTSMSQLTELPRHMVFVDFFHTQARWKAQFKEMITLQTDNFKRLELGSKGKIATWESYEAAGQWHYWEPVSREEFGEQGRELRNSPGLRGQEEELGSWRSWGLGAWGLWRQHHLSVFSAEYAIFSG